MGKVVGISYIGNEEVEERNLQLLNGKHETFLNNAIFAYESGLIEDWVSFFRSDWAEVVYHDRFDILVKSLKECLYNDVGMKSILDKVFKNSETMTDPELTRSRKEIIGNRGESIPERTNKLIQAEVKDYLDNNKQMLTRFHTRRKKDE